MSNYQHFQNTDNYLTDIIGIRVLKQNPHVPEQYHIVDVFIGENWKENARIKLLDYLGKSNYTFHTFHRFKEELGLPEPHRHRTFWIHSPHFHLSYLT